MTVQELIDVLQTVTDKGMEVVLDQWDHKFRRTLFTKVDDVSTLSEGEAMTKGNWPSADQVVWLRSYE